MLTLKKQPAQARSRSTVEAIVEGAARVLVDAGYAAASTNRIAERAGVSVGSVYEYFEGKQAIFAELCRREYGAWYQTLTGQPRPTEPREVLVHLISSRVQFVGENLALATAIGRDLPREAVADLDAHIFEDFLALSVAYFEANLQHLRPRFQQVELGFLAELLMRSVSSTIHDFAVHSPERLYDGSLQRELIAMVDGYLVATSPKPE